MSRRSHKSGRGSAIVIIVVAAAVIMYSQGWSSTAIFNTLVIGLLLIVVVGIFYRPIIGVFRIIRGLIQKQRLKHIARSNLPIEAMTWAEFEYFVADWLRNRGYTDVLLTEHYDLGVDIVAKKDYTGRSFKELSPLEQVEVRKDPSLQAGREIGGIIGKEIKQIFHSVSET